MHADDAIQQQVLAVLGAFNNQLAARDLDGVLGLFVSDPDVTLVGSEAGEIAVGPGELRAFFLRIFARAGTFRSNGAAVASRQRVMLPGSSPTRSLTTASPRAWPASLTERPVC
jgi:hypothetical protein